MGSIGSYKEAVDLLKDIDRSKLSNVKLIDYFNSYARVYGELAFYTQDKRESKVYWKVFDANLIFLKASITSDNPLYLKLKEDSARNAHKFDEALKLNQILLLNIQYKRSFAKIINFLYHDIIKSFLKKTIEVRS